MNTIKPAKPKSLTDKTIVLDLDQTLVATQDYMDSLAKLQIMKDPSLLELRNRVYILDVDNLEGYGSGSNAMMWGIKRPYVDEFLRFCYSYFAHVIVWSAGRRHYVEAVIDNIFKDLPYPETVFTYDETLVVKGDVIKDLEFLLASNTNLQIEKILVLDDNITTFSRNVDNGVLIAPYDPKLKIDDLYKPDTKLFDFRNWLMTDEVIKSQDTRTLNKIDLETI